MTDNSESQPDKCPKCGGYWYREYDYMVCVNCGREEYAGGEDRPTCVSHEGSAKRSRRGESRTMTARRVSIARMLDNGFSYREICGELGISISTLRSHLSLIREVLGAGTTGDIPERARELGYLE